MNVSDMIRRVGYHLLKLRTLTKRVWGKVKKVPNDEKSSTVDIRKVKERRKQE